MTVRADTAGDNVYLKVSADCEVGATVTYAGADATEVGRALAKDGRLAALVLHPTSANVELSVERSDHPTYLVQVIRG